MHYNRFLTQIVNLWRYNKTLRCQDSGIFQTLLLCSLAQTVPLLYLVCDTKYLFLWEVLCESIHLYN